MQQWMGTPPADETWDEGEVLKGNVDAFLAYVEDGRAYQDWCMLVTKYEQQGERWLHAHARYWVHLAIPVGKAGIDKERHYDHGDASDTP